MTVGVDFKVRSATQADHRQIANLLHISLYIHRHLDWRYPLDWIGSPPFYVLERQGQIISTLGCPPDPPTVAWIRLFASSPVIPLEDAWETLWEVSRKDLASTGPFIAAAIVLHDWYHKLLIDSGFTTNQSIVMLEREEQAPLRVSLPPRYKIRNMLQFDLAAVGEVDSGAFDLLWQNSLSSLERAYPQAVLATVAEVDGQIIAYQLSTRNPLGAHLARLAVLPAFQGLGIGMALVADLVQQANTRGMYRLSVNTQSDNTSSLKLYAKAGFRETGERFQVYQQHIP